MIHLLVGHRGSGKSAFLKRIGKYFPQDVCLDLDQEIEKREGSIEDIIANRGEAIFRQFERKIFDELISQWGTSPQRVWICLGAGFSLDTIAKEHFCIFWISRSTDSTGRIFLDRPRLNANLSPLAESLEKYQIRQPLFEAAFDYRIDCFEGDGFFQQQSLIEKQVIEQSFECRNFGFTLLLADVQNVSKKRFSSYQQWIRQNQVKFLEVRDDLIPIENFKGIFDRIDSSKILFSFRDPNMIAQSIHWIQKFPLLFAIDWDQQLGPIPESLVTWINQNQCILFISSHTENPPKIESLWKPEAMGQLGNKTFLKWSPWVEDFKTLQQHLQWRQEGHSYLPRSQTGKWTWLRLYLSADQPLNFVKIGLGSAADQPSLQQALRQQNSTAKNFTAVLGQPVQNSFSPQFHFDFFQHWKMSFYAIEIAEQEWTTALPVLRNLGLQFAAVTSPLKQKAFESAEEVSELGAELHSVNTILFLQKIIGENTDLEGFRNSSLKDLSENVLIWGGGGTRKMLRKLIPNGIFMSARHPDLSKLSAGVSYDLIWAAPRKKGVQFPPSNISIRKIFDLNYADNSYGKELALARRIPYESGLEMFKMQGYAQQRIFKNFNKES